MLLFVLTTAVFVAEIGEAPHVGQIDGEADHGQQEVRLLAPCLSLLGVDRRIVRPHNSYCKNIFKKINFYSNQTDFKSN